MVPMINMETFRLVMVILYVNTWVSAFEYIFGISENHRDPSVPFGRIYITNPCSLVAFIRVRTPLLPGGINQCHAITPGGFQVITLNYDGMMIATEKANKGILVWSDQAVHIQILSVGDPGSTDGYYVPPVHNLGRHYIAVTYKKPNSANALDGPYHIGVTASEHNTNVAFYLGGESPVTVVYEGVTYINGDTLTVSLDQFQTLQIEAAAGSIGSTGDITGTVVTSDKPVHMVCGAKATVVDGTSADTLKVSPPDVSSLGNQYVIIPVAMRAAGDRIKVIATNDSTQVDVFDNVGLVSSVVLDSYNQISLVTDSDKLYRVLSSKPVMVAHLARSRTLEPTFLDTDPFLTTIPAVSAWSNNYHFTTMKNTDDVPFVDYINVAIATADIPGLRLDGVVVVSSNWLSVLGTLFSGAQIPVTQGTHRLYHVTGQVFGVVLYGQRFGESYGMELRPSLLPETSEAPGRHKLLRLKVENARVTNVDAALMTSLVARSKIGCVISCLENPCNCRYVQFSQEDSICLHISPGVDLQTTSSPGTHIYLA